MKESEEAFSDTSPLRRGQRSTSGGVAPGSSSQHLDGSHLKLAIFILGEGEEEGEGEGGGGERCGGGGGGEGGGGGRGEGVGGR